MRLFVVLSAFLAASPCLAQDTPQTQLGGVRELMLHANFRGALPEAQRLLARTDLSAEDRNAGLEALATIHLALRQEADARTALAQLYARDPGHRLMDPDASPVVQSAFARAREAAHPIAVALDHAPPVLERRAAPAIDARLGDGADAVHEIHLFYRQPGETRFTTIVMAVDLTGAAQGRIPVRAEGDEAYSVEYYLEAVAPSGTVLARAGSSTEPLSVAVPEAEAQVIVSGGTTEIVRSDDTGITIALVLVGVLVVGGGVGAGVGIYYGTQGPEAGTLDTITLPLLRY